MIKSFDLAVKPNENFVRAYKNVLSKDFCAHLIDKFEKVKEEYVDDRELTGKKGKEWDGITHIVWEWTIDQKSKDCLFKDKTTNWNKIAGLNRTVAFCCYWFDKYMIGKTGAKLGNNWQEVPKKWKDEQVTTLNSLFNMKTPVTV